MAWTTPRTWVPGETVTASLMNTHVRDNFNALYTKRGCRLSLTSNETVSSGTPLSIPWDQADFDSDSFWSAGSATRLTIPTGMSGLYLIGYAYRDNDSTGGSYNNFRVAGELRLNGSTILAADEWHTSAEDDNWVGATGHYFGNLDAADYLELQVSQDSTVSMSMRTQETTLWALFLGPQL